MAGYILLCKTTQYFTSTCKSTTHHWGPQHCCWVVSWQHENLCQFKNWILCIFWKYQKNEEEKLHMHQISQRMLFTCKVRNRGFSEILTDRVRKIDLLCIFGKIQKIKRKNRCALTSHHMLFVSKVWNSYFCRYWKTVLTKSHLAIPIWCLRASAVLQCI